ncbi:hypothetical protein L6R53_20665 [Myxococcota bacterium]|nr:hypothetical protein [Myxococcota bacterium]
MTASSAGGRPTSLQGVACAPGRAAGRTLRWPRDGARVAPEAGPHSATRTLEAALARVAEELDRRHARLGGHGEDERGLVEVQQALLSDPAFAGQARALVERGAPAAVAIEAATDHAVATLLGPGDPTLAARCADVRLLGERLLRALEGGVETAPLPDRPVILVCADLAPDELLELLGPSSAATRRVRAVLLARGGPLTHLAILARGRGVPVVGGLAGLPERLEDGRGALVDGDRGRVVLDPDAAACRAFLAARPHPPPPAARRLNVLATIDLPEEAPLARALGATGIGLLRTDRLLRDGDAPGVEEQARRYALALRCFPGTTVVIRTFDAAVPGPDPALGPRGVRWLRLAPERSRDQVRALCMAAARVPETRLCLLLPMVSAAEEVALAREEVRRCWTADGPAPAVGAMVETPAAALEVERLLDVAELLVIGSNDLLQLTVGASREDPRVADRLDPDHPALWRLLRQVAAAGRARGRPVLLCGALAADLDRLARVAALDLAGVGVGLADLRRVARILTSPGVDTAPRGS